MVCSENQLTGFYMMGTLVVKWLKTFSSNTATKLGMFLENFNYDEFENMKKYKIRGKKNCCHKKKFITPEKITSFANLPN